MLNYEIDPALLQPFVPRGTELDSFEGKTYVSLVGLRFARTKLYGLISVPFHSDFDEVNLRIYVRRREGSEIRRGVMFIREIVSLPAVTLWRAWHTQKTTGRCRFATRSISPTQEAPSNTAGS